MTTQNRNTLLNGFCLVVGFLAVMRFMTVPANSTEGELRENPCPHTPSASIQGVPCSAVLAAAEVYDRKVRPILQVKCYDCHGVVARLPLYSKIPPVKGMVEDDIRHAKKEFNMSAGFPFMAEKDFLDDLHELREVLEEDRMPPRNYKAMHWKSGLTTEEKKIVMAWAKNIENALKATRVLPPASE
ncbi:MAG: hypothetical protein COB53_00145 [Elusimicrobia bacterium]|nr:MAG: hypothetical protein COB53_00145 [Elusimicrobiota bacterium]